MTPLVFVDTETDGVHPDRKAWEVAMIRRDDTGQVEHHFFIGLDLRTADPRGLEVGRFWDRHPTGRKLSGKPPVPCPPPAPVVYNPHDAAKEVMQVTFGAHLVGLVPSFDADVLTRMLRSQGYLPTWHYHLVDVVALAVGYLHGREGHYLNATEPPWSSEALSRVCGVAPPAGAARHTALGDARWVRDWYDTITGSRPVGAACECADPAADAPEAAVVS